MAAERPKVFEESGTVSLPKRCFQLGLFWSVQKESFCNAPTIRASVAPMTGTRDDHNGDECFINMLLAVAGGLRICRNASRTGPQAVTEE